MYTTALSALGIPTLEHRPRAPSHISISYLLLFWLIPHPMLHWPSTQGLDEASLCGVGVRLSGGQMIRPKSVGEIALQGEEVWPMGNRRWEGGEQIRHLCSPMDFKSMALLCNPSREVNTPVGYDLIRPVGSLCGSLSMLASITWHLPSLTALGLYSLNKVFTLNPCLRLCFLEKQS